MGEVVREHGVAQAFIKLLVGRMRHVQSLSRPRGEGVLMEGCMRTDEGFADVLPLSERRVAFKLAGCNQLRGGQAGLGADLAAA